MTGPGDAPRPIPEPPGGALADGEYDVFVVDADEDPDPTVPGLLHLSLTVIAGDHKGEVVELSAAGLDRDPIDLIGMPGTLTVTAGVPQLRIDDA